jgi:glyoxylate/hydroxypyruvate reductase
MKVLLTGRFDTGERDAWWQALQAAAPECAWLRDDLGPIDREAIDAAVVANPKPGALAGLPRLRLIQSLWAGVDKLLADPTVPAAVPIARMVDPAMNAAMAETALWAVLSLHRRYFDYAEQQQRALWQALPQHRADEVSVLVLGAGQMGQTAADRLTAMGYVVRTWSRRSGEALHDALSGAQIVVNLLPLTDATRGVLNASAFAAMPRGASLVNLARGAHVVDADLLAALASGQLSRAVLDVFHQEPLPTEHPFWRHARITVLPHAAAGTDARSAVAVAADNLRALERGTPLRHLVDRKLGY